MVEIGTFTEKKYTLLDDAEQLKKIYQSEDNHKKRKDLIRKPLWRRKRSVKRCEDCTKKFELLQKRWRCLLCGQVLCKPCVKYISPYILTSKEDEKSFDIETCGRCVLRLEEQYREKQEDNNLQETIMKLKQQLELWNTTWDKYIKMNESRGKSSGIDEIHKELLKRIDEVTYYKHELIINWRDDSGIITRETYDDIMSTCDNIIGREKALVKDHEKKKQTQEDGKKIKKRSCCSCFRHCLRWFRCCGAKDERDKDETEYKIDATAQEVEQTVTQAETQIS